MEAQTAKSRHGCLTAYLVFMMVMNAGTAVFYLVASDQVRAALPNAPQWLLYGLTLLALFNLVCAIALFQWRMWGFWGFAASSIVALGANLMLGLGVGQSLIGLAGIAILFGVLQIGDARTKGWPQLE